VAGGLPRRCHRRHQLAVVDLSDIDLAVQDIAQDVQVVGVLCELLTQGQPDVIGEPVGPFSRRLGHDDHGLLEKLERKLEGASSRREGIKEGPSLRLGTCW
jgi:hypothetical protein